MSSLAKIITVPDSILWARGSSECHTAFTAWIRFFWGITELGRSSGLAFFGDRGQVDLLGFDLRQERARGKDALGHGKHVGEGGARRRQFLVQASGLLERIERLLLKFDGIIRLVFLEQRGGFAHGPRHAAETVDQRQIIFAGARLGFLPADDVAKKTLRIIGQCLVQRREKRGFASSSSAASSVCSRSTSKRSSKFSSCAACFPEMVTAAFMRASLGHGLHPPAGDLRQLLKCGLCLLVMTGCSLAVASSI